MTNPNVLFAVSVATSSAGRVTLQYSPPSVTEEASMPNIAAICAAELYKLKLSSNPRFFGSVTVYASGISSPYVSMTLSAVTSSPLFATVSEGSPPFHLNVTS